MRRLSTSDKITLFIGIPGLLLACLGMIAAWLAVPQLQEWLNRSTKSVGTSSALATAKLSVGVFETPGDAAKKVAEMPLGGTAKILAKNQSGTWLLIEFPETKQTWISMAAVNISGALDQIPAYDSSATNTPTIVRPIPIPSSSTTLDCISHFTSTVATEISPKIPQIGPLSSSVGTFFQNDLVLPFEFVGNEQVCLASSMDGRGSISVDDQLEFRVTHVDGNYEIFTHEFFDSITGTITPLAPQDVSRLFKGRYNIVRLTLRDFYPQYHGSSSIYLNIGRPQ